MFKFVKSKMFNMEDFFHLNVEQHVINVNLFQKIKEWEKVKEEEINKLLNIHLSTF